MVLDDLYCGNIYPAEQVVPHEKEYRKLHAHKRATVFSAICAFSSLSSHGASAADKVQ